jgi:ATP-dependent helicase Lhr and Lhr-like helicase
LQRAVQELQSCDPRGPLPVVDPQALDGLKFSDCLPPGIGLHVLGVRGQDPAAVAEVLAARVRLVSG